MASERRLTGWPPSTSKPASAAELARARQTGQTVQQLRNEQQRMEAAEVIEQMLADDKAEHRPLGDRRRWALHLAVGVLKTYRFGPVPGHGDAR